MFYWIVNKILLIISIQLNSIFSFYFQQYVKHNNSLENQTRKQIICIIYNKIQLYSQITALSLGKEK